MTDRRTWSKVMKGRIATFAREHGPQEAGKRWNANATMIGRWVREGWGTTKIATKQHTRKAKTNGLADPQQQAIISLERYLKAAGDPLTFSEQDTNVLLALQAIRKLS